MQISCFLFLREPGSPFDYGALRDMYIVLMKFSLVSAQKEGGTQIKLVIDYEKGGQALFKPMR